MKTTIPAFCIVTLIVLAPEGAAQKSPAKKTGSRTLVEVPSNRPGVAPLTTRTSCFDKIEDQATGNCLQASSTPTFGLLFPYPGINNTFVGPAFVGGGEDNQATGTSSTVAGGRFNIASGEYATVGGGGASSAGYGNTASGRWATVGGGLLNTASGETSVVGGGGGNTASGPYYSTVGGGKLNTASGYYGYSTVGGGANNVASGDYATVGGGGYAGLGYFGFGGNTASGGASTVGGGSTNVASGEGATVGGGIGNVASGEGATVAGGGQVVDPIDSPTGNTASGTAATVGGGFDNIASGVGATVGGGGAWEHPGSGWVGGNTSSGRCATVPGGAENLAQGDYSFAAGRRAKANHDGAFVWGDSVEADKPSSVADEFNVYASGGVRMFTNSAATTGAALAPGSGTWSMLSDRDAKENVEPVDAHAVLQCVVAMPLATWNYTEQGDSVRHMGPMAQDFRAAFGLGVSDKLIDAVDSDGVALAAIQGLNAVDQELRDLIAEKDAEIADLRARLDRLEASARTN